LIYIYTNTGLTLFTVDFDGNVHMFMTGRKGKFFLYRHTLTGSEVMDEYKYILVL